MVPFKCKMCGGFIELVDDRKVCECKLCGSKQTVTTDDEAVLDIVNRANTHRNKCEFVEAEDCFKALISSYPDEAEGYWGLCLCKYGVTYETDGETVKRFPCCHKTSMESIFDDNNFKTALEKSGDEGKMVLKHEASAIEKLQIEAFKSTDFKANCDIVICYVENDSQGLDTSESVLAYNIHTSLTKEKMKSVLLGSCLKERLGTAFSSYVNSAVSNARIMIAVGTSNNNFYLDQMRSLWGGFLDRMSEDENKTLMVCYKSMTEEDLPQEFENAKKYDAGYHNAIKEIIDDAEHFINSYRRKENNKTYMSTANAMIEKGFNAISGKDWAKATDVFDKAISIYPKSSKAYFGKFLISQKLREKEVDKIKFKFSLMENEDFSKAYSLATGKEKALYEKMLRNNSSLVERAYMWLSEGDFTEASRLASQELISNSESSQAYFINFLCDKKYKSYDVALNAKIHYILQNDENFKRAYLYANEEEKAKLDKLLNKNKNVVEKENQRYAFVEKNRKPYLDKYRKINDAMEEMKAELKELEEEGQQKQEILKRLDKFKMLLLAVVLVVISGGACFGIMQKILSIPPKTCSIVFGVSAVVLILFTIIYSRSEARKKAVEKKAFKKYRRKNAKYSKEIEKLDDELLEVGDIILCATCGSVKKTTHGHCKVCDGGAWFRVRYVFTDPDDCRRHMITAMPQNYDFMFKEIKENTEE